MMLINDNIRSLLNISVTFFHQIYGKFPISNKFEFTPTRKICYCLLFRKTIYGFGFLHLLKLYRSVSSENNRAWKSYTVLWNICRNIIDIFERSLSISSANSFHQIHGSEALAHQPWTSFYTYPFWKSILFFDCWLLDKRSLYCRVWKM